MTFGFNLLAAALASLFLGATQLSAAEVAVPPFYASVMAMKPDGKLGQVIASEPVATKLAGARAWRIAYVSSDVLERPTISTGLVIAPVGDPPKEGRPILAWAHGTTGTAQNCGPSQVLDPAQGLNEYFLVGGTSYTDFGMPAAEAFLKLGYVLVATDYQGLGGGGTHHYAIAATQARDTINSIRAAGAMGLSGVNRKAAIYGWSQGGGATLASASLPDYIAKTGTAFDGVELVGFAALAPYEFAAMVPQGPIDDAAATKMLGGLVKPFSNSVFNFSHLIMTFWATPAAFPDVKLTDLLTEDGARVIDEVYSKKCMHPGADTISHNFGATYKSLLKPAPANAGAWIKRLIEGSVAPVKPVAPVIIFYGTKDVVVPPAMGAAYRAQMCKLGGDVTRVQLPGEQDHFSTPVSAQPLFVAWLKDRFDGVSAVNGCHATESGKSASAGSAGTPGTRTRVAPMR